MPPDPHQFLDRPGTRIRIELAPEPQPPRRVLAFFKAALKLIYACAAGALCVALLSYVPTGGRSFTQFVPTDCAAMLRIPSGAALHRALAQSDTVKQLLDDPDTGAFMRELTHWTQKPTERTGSVQERINAEFEKLSGHWWSAFAPSRGTDMYPLVGGECAVCFSLGDSTKKARTLLFTRVRGSDGFLLRVAMPFVHLKDVEFFDLGGGLIAAGFNGSRPQFGAHALPPIAANLNPNGPAPLLQITCNPKLLEPPQLSADAVREKLNAAIIDSDNTLSTLSEEGVPDAILFALLRPPTIPEMANFHELPEAVRIDVFERDAAQGGGVEAIGTVTGAVPPLPFPPEKETAMSPRFSQFKTADTMAELTLPVDTQAMFISYVANVMRLTGAVRLTRGQARWIARFRALESSEAEPDKYLWPAVGHVFDVSVHEPKKDALTALGAVQGWLPFKPAHPGDALFAARELARARWDYLLEEDQKLSGKVPSYVRRFGDPHSIDGNYGSDYEDRYALASSLVTPAWGVGSKGARITLDAGPLALHNGPNPKEFPQPPEHLDAYRIKLDGARLAATAEAVATLLYDDLEDEIGNAQKFHSQYPNRDLHLRLARKWMSALGDFELTLKPNERGGALRLNWRGGRVPETASTQPVRILPQKSSDKKTDPDDTDVVAPPPPPPGK